MDISIINITDRILRYKELQTYDGVLVVKVEEYSPVGEAADDHEIL